MCDFIYCRVLTSRQLLLALRCLKSNWIKARYCSYTNLDRSFLVGGMSIVRSVTELLRWVRRIRVSPNCSVWSASVTSHMCEVCLIDVIGRSDVKGSSSFYFWAVGFMGINVFALALLCFENDHDILIFCWFRQETTWVFWFVVLSEMKFSVVRCVTVFSMSLCIDLLVVAIYSWLRWNLLVNVIHWFSCAIVLVVQVICKPGTVKTSTKFEAEVYILTKEEGGRHTAFFSNYRPQFYLRTADITGKVELPEHIKMVMPGDNLTAQFELIIPCPLEHGMYTSCDAYAHLPNVTPCTFLFLFPFDRKVVK